MEQITIDFYHSTSKSKVARFKEAVRAGVQTDLVWELMADGKKRTSYEVHRQLGINLNSTRRALSDLKKKFELIEKLEDGRVEQDGAFNHYYLKV